MALAKNPLLCEGQIHGGIVQGIGQVLMEDIVYDPESRRYQGPTGAVCRVVSLTAVGISFRSL
jgi:carbon-monoxide dehydrogenase large subunit